MSDSARPDPVHRGGISSGELRARHHGIPCRPHRARQLTLQVFRVAPTRTSTMANITMNGVPVTRKRAIGSSEGHRVLQVWVGRWPSGLYFARLVAVDGRVGFAPFVVPPNAWVSTESPSCCRR